MYVDNFFTSTLKNLSKDQNDRHLVYMHAEKGFWGVWNSLDLVRLELGDPLYSDLINMWSTFFLHIFEMSFVDGAKNASCDFVTYIQWELRAFGLDI